MFPPDRFEATWVYPQPFPEARKATGRLPIGDPKARAIATLWLDPEDRLALDWPGFPGTIGAKVTLTGTAVTGTRDPALSALAAPLRRRAVETFNRRCMIDYGLADDDVGDFVACHEHGTSGIKALACAHVIGHEPVDAVVLYDVDGDYPDCLCTACFDAFRAGDTEVTHVVCSRCQQRNLYRHRLVATTTYGA